jgi:hypothetical protein
MRITVPWEVSDGYIGKSRPQKTIIEVDDEHWEELNETEREELIEEHVQAHFNEEIGFEIDHECIDYEDE